MNIEKLVDKKLKTLTKQKFTNESDIFEIGIDSLDLVELVTEAEDELGIQVSDEALASIKTVKDISRIFEEAK